MHLCRIRPLLSVNSGLELKLSEGLAPLKQNFCFLSVQELVRLGVSGLRGGTEGAGLKKH